MRPLVLVLICAISCGCREAAEPVVENTAPAQHRVAVKLSILVVDDAEIAKGIRLLSGEWNERSGGDLVVAEATLEELLAAENLPSDLVIYPSRHLGTLATKGALRPVRQSVLDDPALAWGDLLPAYRNQLVRYGEQVLALPLGDMPLVMAWHGESVQPLPVDWQQFDRMPIRTGGDDSGQFALAKVFLARALAATPADRREGLLFEGDAMRADLSQPQMVTTLDQMAESAKKIAPSSASVTLPRKPVEPILSTLIASTEVYNSNLQQWELKDETSAPVIFGFAGRLVSVTASSRNAASAFKLLPWLVSGSTGAQLSRNSPATLWFRASQVSQARRWLGDDIKDNRVRWLTDVMSRGDAYLLPRISGIDQYLQELESALERTLAGEQAAAASLIDAERRWNAITDKLGPADQRAAFNRHLGLAQ